jgi:hypothetical protein
VAITKEQLRDEVKTQGEDALLERCLAVTDQLLTTYLEDNLDAADLAALPDVVRDQAWLTAAVDAFNQSKAPNGIVNQEYDLGNGEVTSTPVRISRDPLRGARAVLEMYVGPAIA